MTALVVLGAVLLFALGLMASIALHELGHLSFAKLFRVRTPQYMIGFGPTVFSRRRGETEYGVKAIPLGGYIRMIGMYPPGPGEDERHLRRASTSPWGSVVENARAATLEEIRPEDGDRVFYRLAWWKKVLVMLAGPAMNLVVAVVCLTVLLCGLGTEQPTTLVSGLRCATPDEAALLPELQRRLEGVSDPDEASRIYDDLFCPADAPVSPARAGGVRVGDRVVAVGGQEIGSWEDLTTTVSARSAGPVDVVVERDGERLDLTVDLATVLRVPADAEPAADGTYTGVPTTYLGVSPTSDLVRQPLTAVPGAVGSYFVTVGESVLRIPQRVPALVGAILGGEREADGPIGIVGIGRISAEVATTDQLDRLGRVAFGVQLLASLNMGLFLFNLLPLLPLDGGHVAGALWEALRRGAARLRGRPDPGWFDTARLMPAAYLVAGVLVVFTVLVLVADVVNPVRVFS